jgi:hypothetical protein
MLETILTANQGNSVSNLFFSKNSGNFTSDHTKLEFLSGYLRVFMGDTQMVRLHTLMPNLSSFP